MNNTSELKSSTNCHCESEEALPNIQGQVITYKFRGRDLNVVKKDKAYVLEGDIILSPEQIALFEKSTKQKFKGSFAAIKTAFINTWQSGVVYWDVDSNVPNQSRITNAIATWEAYTRIRFVRKSGYASSWVHIKRGDGCSSFVGRKMGEQELTLSDDCSEGNTLHELGHAIGLFHEQSREDRDLYINIHEENIELGKKHNFEKYSESGDWGLDYGPFDFNSIMMYSSKAFSKNNLPTITKKDGTEYSTNRSYLTQTDIDAINYLYEPIGIGYDETQNWYQDTGFDRVYDSDVEIYFTNQTGRASLTKPIEVRVAKYRTEYNPLGQGYGSTYAVWSNVIGFPAGVANYYAGTYSVNEHYNQRMDPEPNSFYEYIGAQRLK
ncbi:hypothetical protein GCM10011425_35650 [Mucilaginibacter galii]|uniref:Peptidase M12A domain-containing protein n=1 Tax=Mucilaginibacter galii TaxID=2005073 RepID=A0A917N2X5_9SPHI|nr:hypothetical protein GCM10011425_35650 [Mucilaginibacter galii]